MGQRAPKVPDPRAAGGHFKFAPKRPENSRWFVDPYVFDAEKLVMSQLQGVPVLAVLLLCSLRRPAK